MDVVRLYMLIARMRLILSALYFESFPLCDIPRYQTATARQTRASLSFIGIYFADYRGLPFYAHEARAK